MNLYWSQIQIPALKRLSSQERAAAKRAVIGKVWKHWQVWLPFATLIAAYFAFFILAPRFPYRLPIVIVTLLATSRVAALPFSHYLQHYLNRNDPKS
jgi:MFS superfamily sulfate permease-like transporter